MKRYEYKKLQDKPLLAITDPQSFENWMLQTLNRWGAEGWRAVQVTTPIVGNQLTGDLIVLAEREVPDNDVESNKAGYQGGN